MVEVFKTGITDVATASRILKQLEAVLPGAEINFDLEDCDNILRVAGKENIKETVMFLLSKHGYYCDVLD